MHFDPARCWRHVKVTGRRSGVDFAECLRELVEVHYPKAQKIRLVLDNLSTHSEGSLYECLPPAEARRILSRLEFHYTPKHASWRNQAEIESGALRKQCLDRRLGSREALAAEVAAWQRARNAERAAIRWLFTCEKARQQMPHAYPVLTEEPLRRAA